MSLLFQVITCKPTSLIVFTVFTVTENLMLSMVSTFRTLLVDSASLKQSKSLRHSLTL